MPTVPAIILPSTSATDIRISYVVFEVIFILGLILLVIFITLKLSHKSFRQINIAIYVTLAILAASLIALSIIAALAMNISPGPNNNLPNGIYYIDGGVGGVDGFVGQIVANDETTVVLYAGPRDTQQTWKITPFDPPFGSSITIQNSINGKYIYISPFGVSLTTSKIPLKYEDSFIYSPSVGRYFIGITGDPPTPCNEGNCYSLKGYPSSLDENVATIFLRCMTC